MFSAKTAFAYLAYAAAATALFLYLLFPEETVTSYLDGRLAALDPSMTLNASSIRPTFPPGLKLAEVDVNRNGVRMIRLDGAWVFPELMSLLRGEPLGRFKARVAEGEINGRASMNGGGSEARMMIEMDLADIRLERLDAVQHLDRFTLSGLLSGRLTHTNARGRIGSVNGTINASPLTIILASPFFGISELIINQADLEFSINGPNMRLAALTFGGPMIEGRINGTINLRRPLEKSQLSLSGNVKPQPELIARLQESASSSVINPSTLGTKGMMFRLSGPIDDPEVSIR